MTDHATDRLTDLTPTERVSRLARSDARCLGLDEKACEETAAHAVQCFANGDSGAGALAKAYLHARELRRRQDRTPNVLPFPTRRGQPPAVVTVATPPGEPREIRLRRLIARVAGKLGADDAKTLTRELGL